MDAWLLGSISIKVELGHEDDSDLDLVIKANDIPLGLDKSGISVREGSNAEEILQWPGIKMSDPNRRQAIYDATKSALEMAEKVEAKEIGFFTTGLEVARIPSWEVAEEIVKAVHAHSKNESTLNSVVLVASSPTQLSSFQFALNNITTILPDERL
ncbi:MAG: hypothetical protein ACFFE6_03785 [Candidatus Thorarchaeota archaeon]